MNLRIGVRNFVTMAVLLGLSVPAALAGPTQWSILKPALQAKNAASAPMLAAARAGQRIVAVGDHGIVLLSDDGSHFRQAKTVPCRSMLTSVQFVDERHGFAAGHDGVVLSTDDAGETWRLIRSTAGVERPVLALYFDDPQHGFIAGLYGWAMETHDGGRSWTELQVGDEANHDRHLFDMFRSSRGTRFLVAEAGTIFRSNDDGKTWQIVTTGDEGSLWRGISLADGTLLVCGMRGHIYRSVDDGLNWSAVDAGTTQSLTGMAQRDDGSVVIAGMNGTTLLSTDQGQTFLARQSSQGEALTDVLSLPGKLIFISMTGPITRDGGHP